MLADAQIERYSRQIILPRFGGRGQERLLAASVAIIGVDRHAAIAAHYLAAAGVGRLRAPSAIVAALAEVNADCRFQPFATPLEPRDADVLLGDHDVVVDASGQRWISLLLNAAAITLQRPFIWAAISGSGGRLAIFAGYRPDMACFECLQETAPVSLVGPDAFLETTAAFIGAAIATAAIQSILGLDTHLAGRMLRYEVLDTTLGDTAIAKDPSCPRCSPVQTRGVAR